MRLQAVLFDLWGTLILDASDRSQPRQAWRAANVQRVLMEHGADFELDAVDQALRHGMRALGAMQDEGIDCDALGRVGIFRDELHKLTERHFDVEADAAVALAITALHPELSPRVEPNAVATLAAVKALGLKTALISNTGFTTADQLRGLLDVHGLSPYLDVLVFSDELLAAKPDRRLFTHALEALHVPADACVFVGDTPHNDVFGAQSAGIFAVQVRDKTHATIVPEAQIAGLEHLIDALRAHAWLPSLEAAARDS